MKTDEVKQYTIQKFPDLAVQGSPMNVGYMTKLRAYRAAQPDYFQNPQWPWMLAMEVAAELQIKPLP
jgi:hypothetical protein